MSAPTKLEHKSELKGDTARLSSILKCAAAVLAKDIRCEFRAKQAISAILLFAVTTCVAVSFTLQGRLGGNAVASAMLWVVIYFSAMSGLSRSFVHEEETMTSPQLKLAASPSGVYLGKLAFNCLMVLALELIAVPLLIVFANLSVAKWGQFAGILLLGGLGLSAGSTTAAAMVSRAATKGAVFAVICFPLLVPVLAAAVHGTNAAMDTRVVLSAASDLKILVSYCGTVITASLLLFRFIWED